MPTQAEMMARRIVRDVQSYTGRRPMQWALLDVIAKRLLLTDDEAMGSALQHGIDSGWMIVAGGHSICLTDDGRKLI